MRDAEARRGPVGIRLTTDRRDMSATLIRKMPQQHHPRRGEQVASRSTRGPLNTNLRTTS